MNRSLRLREVFRRFGDVATLGQLIEATREDGGLAYKLTAAISELRDDLRLETPAKTLKWERRSKPGMSVYRIVPVEKV